MIIKNAIVYNEDFDPVKTDIEIENGKIKALAKTEAEGIDYSGCIVLPGFIDIHIHGCNSADATDGKEDSVLKMSRWLATKGVTSFCPTTMTLPKNELKKSFTFIKKAMGNEPGAYIHGVNMEGPFISHAKKGAQAGEHIIAPDIEFLNELNSICPVKLTDIAPEVEGAYKFIKKAKEICTVSIAHTTADYKTTKESIEHGITHATHLYNAMNGLTSREAGAVGAILDSECVNAEMICDGIHICEPTLRITFKALGEDRTIAISDAMMAAGLPDGEYALGGQKVIVKGDARLEDGTLAGSITNLFDEFNNLIKFGIPLKQAIKSVTINPAKAIGADKETGSIAVGKNADLVILSADFKEIKTVIIKGNII